MRWALERRRAGKVVVRAMRLVHSRSAWKRIGRLLKSLLVLARQEKHFGRATQTMIVNVLAPLQKQLGVQLAPVMHNPASPSLAKVVAPSPSGTLYSLSISRAQRRELRRDAAGLGARANTPMLKTPMPKSAKRGMPAGFGCFTTASELKTPARKPGALDDVLTPLPCSMRQPFGLSAQPPRLTARDLAVIFCNLRNLNEISSELVLSVAATMRHLPRIDLSLILGIYDVLFAALCRYMCNFPQAMEVLVLVRLQDTQHNPWWTQVLFLFLLCGPCSWEWRDKAWLDEMEVV